MTHNPTILRKTLPLYKEVHFIWRGQGTRGSMVYHIHSPRIATKSSIHIKCHSCTLNKHHINKTPSSSSAVYTKKEELIDGKKAMITTDNFMGGEPITFIKYLFEEDKK